MLRFVAIVILAGLTLPMFIVGCAETPAAVPALPPRVSVMHPEERELADHEEFNGWMAADKTVEVRSRVRGHIQKVNFSDGQYVNKGDLLFQLDPRPFERDIDAAEQKVKVAEAQKLAADKDADRYRELVPQRAASQKDLDKAVANAASLGAEIDALLHQVERLKLDLEYSRITADISGRVGKAELTEGNLVNAGGSDPLLTTIVSLDPMRVYFNIDERSLQRYATRLGARGETLVDMLAHLKDQNAKFQFERDGETGYMNEGTLRFGDKGIDPTTGTILVYGDVSNDKRMFVPGSRVRVRLTIGQPYKAWLVPDAAILSDQDKRYVLIVDDKNWVRRRNVILGALTDDGMRSIQPADKLAEGEDVAKWNVIVDNLQRARLNYPVEIVPSETPAAGKE